MEKLKIDYDSQWKEIIGEFFEDFTEFFMPDLHKDIDFAKPIEFLEQELLDIFKTKYKGKRINDKLVKVYLKDGSEKWLLIHIEVQASFETEFSERMFLYYALIYTKYTIKDISAIAIFTNNKVPKKYSKFEHSLYGTTISYKYNSYRIIDQKEAELLKSKNPFALAVLANLYVLQTNQKYEERLIYKEKLFEIAKKLRYDERKLIRLLIFVRNLMVLPQDLEIEFASHIKDSLQNDNIMRLNEGDKRMLEAMYVAICGETPEQTNERIKVSVTEETKNLIIEKLKPSIIEEAKPSIIEEAKPSIIEEAKPLIIEEAKPSIIEEAKPSIIEEAKPSIEEARVKRLVIRYYEKNQFNGLAEFCEMLEIDYLFAESTIIKYLEEEKKP